MVEDLVCHTMADFWEYVEKGSPVKYVRALIKTIGNRRATDYVRKRLAQPHVESLDSDFAHESRTPVDSKAMKAFGQLFTNALLDRLPAHLRSLAYLRFGAGLTVDQAAHELGITRDVAKKRSVDMLNLLRQRENESEPHRG